MKLKHTIVYAISAFSVLVFSFLTGIAFHSGSYLAIPLLVISLLSFMINVLYTYKLLSIVQEKVEFEKRCNIIA